MDGVLLGMPTRPPAQVLPQKALGSHWQASVGLAP